MAHDEIAQAARRGDYPTVLRLARLARGWSQNDLARRVRYDRTMISRLETGGRALTNMALLRRFSDALGVPPGMLGLAATEGDDDVQRRELLSGLAGLIGPSMLGQPDNPTSAHTTEDLRATLRSGRAQFARCNYRGLAPALPQLLTAGQEHLHQLGAGRERDLTASLVADTYSLASALAHKLGDRNLAWILADRALPLAWDSGDGPTIAEATRQAAVAMRHSGYRDSASTLVTSTIERIDTTTPRDLDAVGGLLLTAAYTAAGQHKTDEATVLLDEARAVAARLPEHWPATATFGLTQIATYEIGVHNALGDSAAALTVARAIGWPSLPTPARRVRVCVDTARAWHLHGNRAESTAALLAAERCAAQEVHRPSIQALVIAMLDEPGPTPSGLVGLANRIGVT
jgi:transcriptional regulator with XRE-family HTH domain